MMRAVRIARDGAPGVSPAGTRFARGTSGKRRSGFTMLELMVAIAIILVLVGLAIMGTRAAHSFMRKSNCEQQLKVLQNAINQYSDFWQPWRVGNVVVANKGWPDFIPGRLFATGSFGGPFPTDPGGFNNRLTFDLEGGNSGISYDAAGDMTIVEGDVEYGAECLAYALTAASGKGPYIKDEMKGELQAIHDTEFYPTLMSAGSATARTEYIDPWGTPYRYFWVYADDAATNRALKGYLPVNIGVFSTTTSPMGAGNASVNNPLFKTPSGKYKTAVGYVLESAGPDKRFGNVWKANPTQKEIEDAADNLSVTP